VTLSSGSRLGAYEIISLLGAGGMGVVYRARDTRLNRDVALKVLPAGAAADAKLRDRFDREARAVAALSHPNILAIHDVGVHDGTPYAACELLDGRTLADHIAGTPLPLRTAIDFAAQIGRGLAAAHERNIVHRDLKPANVFVTRDGQVKILDFGLATEPITAAGATAATRAANTDRGVILGTVGYMSPEQARGSIADARSDIFSFGCVLYEMVTGQQPFRRASAIETLHAILTDPVPDLMTSGRPFPVALDRLVIRCLEKDPAARFQTARDLVFALENVVDTSNGSAAVVSPASGARAKWLVAAAGVAIVAVSFGAWRVASRRPPPRAATASDAPRLIAVLPFETITRDGEPDYFGAGMTDEVTGQLSKLSALRVIGRTATATFKDARDLPAMVRELGIGSIVTGSVREEGARVRVRVELTDARSGQVIWSDQYDRDRADVFAVQSEIARRVADALQASVTLDEQARLGAHPTSSVAAYQLFVRARGMRTSVRAELTESIARLRQAVDLDPKFALALSELSRRHQFEAAFGDSTAAARGIQIAHQAIEIDPQLSEARHSLALNLMQAGRAHESLESYKKAIELKPSYYTAVADYAITLNAVGRFDEGLYWARRALQLAPNAPGYHYTVGLQLLYLDDDAVTERFLTAAAARFPTYARMKFILAHLDFRRGRPEAAMDRVRRAVEANPKNLEVLMARAELAALTGAADARLCIDAVLPDGADAPSSLLSHRMQLFQAYVLQAAGEKARAAAMINEVAAKNQDLLTGGADYLVPPIENATIYAIRGDTMAALDWLERAFTAGWRDPRTTKLNPMWASLRGEPRFQQIVSRMEADVAAMRSRADFSNLP
jgi:TolB-like protein